MKVLVLGGTGAMGKHLVELLSNKGINVVVTSRRNIQDNNKIKYIKGNAHDINFIRTILNEEWDAVVDFMSYKTYELKKRLSFFLASTNQYVFLSSARVYAKSSGILKEYSPRILDVSKNNDYLATDEYALAKARQEDLIKESGYQNWTIIRPYITYSEERIQLGVSEKEGWLYRAINGRTIVLPEEIRNKKTTLTYGLDVSKGIAELIGKSHSLGEVFHITTSNNYSLTWEDVLNLYLNVIEQELNFRPNVLFQDTDNFLINSPGISEYQLKYDRLYDRIFDNTKINSFVNIEEFICPEIGLSNSLKAFLKNPKFKYINWKKEAIRDKTTKENAPITQIFGLKNKFKYLYYRHIK